MTDQMKRLLISLGMLLLLAILVSLVLWNVYDPGVWAKQGRWSQQFALSTTLDFALIQTGLSAVVWCCVSRSRTASPVKCFFGGAFGTFAVLMLFVMLRDQYVRLNATDWVFFSEDGILVYLIVIAPLISLLSGGLLCLERILAGVLTRGIKAPD